MSPERKACVGDRKIEEFYWAGSMVVYVNNCLSTLCFEAAVLEAEYHLKQSPAPAFDTAALSIATVDAACVPGGCGGLVVDPDCSVCGGDCSSANPPVYSCPMRNSSAKTGSDNSLNGQRVEALQITNAMVQRARAVIIRGLGSRGYTDIARAALTAALSGEPA